MSSLTPTRGTRGADEPISVLVVDPDEASLDAAKTAFEDEFEIDVTTASRAADAYRSLESVDCVVSDVRIPHTGELEFLRAVRRTHPELPYLIVTDAHDDELVAAALEAGATEFLRKDANDLGYRWLASRVVAAVASRLGAEADQSRRPRYEVVEGRSLLTDSLTYAAVTESYAEILGYDPEALVEEPWATAFSDDDARRLERLVSRADATGSATGELTARRADGTTFSARSTVTRADGGGYVCTITDLTGRVRAETRDDERTNGTLESRLADLERLLEADNEPSHDGEQAVCEAAVDVVADELTLPNVGCYLYDESEDALQRRAVTPGLEDAPRERPFDGASTPEWRAFLDAEAVYVADVRPQPANVVRDPSTARGIVVPIGSHGVLVAGGVEGDRPTESAYTLARLVAGMAATTLDAIARSRRLETCESSLETQRMRTDRLAELTDLVRIVGQVIGTAWTREELEQRLCEALVTNERYAFARIGERDDAKGRLHDRAWAGAEKRYLESLDTNAAALIEDGEPMATAIETLEPRLVRHLLARGVDERWRQDAFARGYRSVLAVPIVFRRRSYGGLAVYSERPAAFDEQERDVFEELGAWLGHAIHAIETKTALVSRGGVELEFRIRDPDIQFLEWARETGSTIEFEAVLSRGDDTIQGVFTVDGAAAETVLELAGRSPAVTDTRLVTERGDRHLFTCTLTEDSIVARLLEYGAVPQTISASGVAGRLVVRLPDHADVRAFVEVFTEMYPDSTLVRRQDREFVTRTEYGFLAELESQLTEKQLEALRTAFVSGYFEVPRETTGEEVAEVLGITQPTFNHHLRVSQQKLLSMVFDGRER